MPASFVTGATFSSGKIGVNTLMKGDETLPLVSSRSYSFFEILNNLIFSKISWRSGLKKGEVNIVATKLVFVVVSRLAGADNFQIIGGAHISRLGCRHPMFLVWPSTRKIFHPSKGP